MVKYHVSPTVLDRFQAWQESESSWDMLYGDSEDPKYTLAEWDEKLEQELIDAVNGVEGEVSRSADLGTCLNEIVDCIILNRQSTRDDVFLQSMDVAVGDGAFERCVVAVKGENKFMFHRDDVVNLASWVKGYVPQDYVSAPIGTRYGEVELYGYPDYYAGSVCVDLKTTRRYEFGKFRYKWQRYVYPYILERSGKMDECVRFDFLVCVVGGDNGRNPFVELTMYRETYTDTVKEMESDIVGVCERFVEWYECAMEAGVCGGRLVGERVE